jgi:NAD dependent epimerase/dehydratase family enzyme
LTSGSSFDGRDQHLSLIPAGRRIDAIVNLSGEPLAGGLWTRARKQRFLESRLHVTGESPCSYV